MCDVDCFSEDQKQFLSLLVADLRGSTATGSLLYLIENMLFTLQPDGKLPELSDAPDLRRDLEVCQAALHYLKVKQATQA